MGIVAGLMLLGLAPVPLHLRIQGGRRRLSVLGWRVPTRHRSLRQSGPGTLTDLGLALARTCLGARWRRFELVVTLGACDAGATALWVGAAHAAWGYVRPWVCERLAPSRPRVRFEPDYGSARLAVELDWILAPRLGALVGAAAGVLVARARRADPSPPSPPPPPSRRRPRRAAAPAGAPGRPEPIRRIPGP